MVDNFLVNCGCGVSPGTLFISSVSKGFSPVSLSQGCPLTWGRLLLLASLQLRWLLSVKKATLQSEL